jgi:hypothetical protein
MKTRLSQRTRQSLLVLVAALAVIAFGSWHGWPAYQYWRVERAIARFEANPSQPAANRLGRVLDAGVPTHKQAKRILGLVFGPSVRARRAYPADSVPKVSLEWPYNLEFSESRVKREAKLWLEGEKVNLGKLEFDPWGHPRRFLTCGKEPLPVGTYDGIVQFDCALTRFRADAPLWWRLRSLFRGRRPIGRTLQPIGSYRTRFEMPLRITVEQGDDAEGVRLVTNPKLDEEVRQSFTCRRWTAKSAQAEQLSASSEVLHLKCTNAPVALAFQAMLRLSDGREIQPRHARLAQLRLRKDESGYLVAYSRRFELRRPGNYRATVVLRPDPNYAYEDPAIKEIWGGTLEYPIHFKIMGIDPDY